MKATIDNIKHLRAETNAPYKDCVSALNESENDIEQAKAILKKAGLSSTRTAVAEAGLIVAHQGLDMFALVKVTCETDFVARSEGFIAAANKIAALAANRASNLSETFKEDTWIFKENIALAQVLYIDGLQPGTHFAYYIHHNGRKAGLITYRHPIDNPKEEQAKKIAIQVVAGSPQYLFREDVSPEYVSKEFKAAKEAALASGKPEQIADRIAQGRLNTEFKEFVLLDQLMYDDPKVTVGDFAKKIGIELLSFDLIVA